MKTQEDIILAAIQKYPEGIHPSTLVAETMILQYNARINGLRDRFNCGCKNNNTICFAKEHIINKRLSNGTTKFFYRKDALDKNEEFKAWVAKKKEERIIINSPSQEAQLSLI